MLPISIRMKLATLSIKIPFVPIHIGRSPGGVGTPAGILVTLTRRRRTIWITLQRVPRQPYTGSGNPVFVGGIHLNWHTEHW